MASPQPLVCTSLHLPPDIQPFLRIHEISLHVFLPNLDCLRLALEADRDINPESTKIFDETRKVLRKELRKAFKDAVYNVHRAAYTGRRCAEKAQEGMTIFRSELESAVIRVSATLDTNYKKGSKTPLTSTENTQSVSEILNAIDEFDVLLQQCHDHLATLVSQTKDKNCVDSSPPSEEEAQVILAKWKTFFDNIKGLWMDGVEIANQIQLPSLDNHPEALKIHKPRKKVPLWRTLFQRQIKRDSVRSTNVLRAPNNPEAAFVTSPSNGSHELQANMVTPALNLAEGPMTSRIT
ncbi:hypothetical protein AGABI1DRAFT_126432 [Agaricus bisporus var. burnettii JB137-S8]|uniref:Uncharacterized protein n=1 Tax=Agaricus bisporus var. burnettii (strain JB137-S8 / ATCC MYA-4627 / FGSC 10392) TaxID=597362 RepID=K5XFD1_AGABU|nr:uncharacterized protein AGABI1DRAFT_126432 [Agaricus bisporus var. burnettii JB137-S8]EKM82083.1 hypothetical protein AGABI1DRAFT_126432 [Agaricus bisporus var. burnettii JB137-S8]